MPTLRFANPQLHAQFLRGVAALPFPVERSADGAVVCTDEQWVAVNDVAHRVRDECFKWYFSWCKTPEATREFETHLRSHGLRYELEHHADGLVFLLPQADKAKHVPFDGPDTCSFCGSWYADRERFYGMGAVAICDQCIREFHADLQSDPPA